jgi:acyl dehydratase
MKQSLTSVAAGATLAERSFGPFAREDLQRYAEASGDLNPLHLDREFARQAGFDDVIIHGMLGMALLGRLLTGSFPSHRLKRFRARFRSVIPIGQAINCAARMESRTEDTATLSLTVQGPTGTLLIEGTATIAVLPGI